MIKRSVNRGDLIEDIKQYYNGTLKEGTLVHLLVSAVLVNDIYKTSASCKIKTKGEIVSTRVYADGVTVSNKGVVHSFDVTFSIPYTENFKELASGQSYLESKYLTGYIVGGIVEVYVRLGSPFQEKRLTVNGRKIYNSEIDLYFFVPDVCLKRKL